MVFPHDANPGDPDGASPRGPGPVGRRDQPSSRDLHASGSPRGPGNGGAPDRPVPSRRRRPTWIAFPLPPPGSCARARRPNPGWRERHAAFRRRRGRRFTPLRSSPDPIDRFTAKKCLVLGLGFAESFERVFPGGCGRDPTAGSAHVEPRIHRVAQSVANEVAGDGHSEDGNSGEGRDPPLLHQFAALGDHGAPLRGWGNRAKAEE